MDSIIYRQLPLMGKPGICQFCGNEVTERKSTYVQLRPLQNKINEIYIDLPHCDNCNLSFATSKYKEEFKEKLGSNALRPIVFQPKKRASLESVKKRINQPFTEISKERNLRKKENNRNDSTVLNSSSIAICNPRLLRKIETVFSNNKCTHCNRPLDTGTIIIPKNNTGSIELWGSVCCKCRTFYLKNQQDIDNILRGNKRATGYTLNGNDLSNLYVKKRKTRSQYIPDKTTATDRNRINKLQNVNSAVAMIAVWQNHKKPIDYIIVNDQRDANIKENILHYTDSFARELLVLVYYPEKLKEDRWTDKQIDTIYPNKKSKWSLRLQIPCDVYIGRDGGFFSSIREGRKFLVDILLYSPYTGKYEIVKATYDQEQNYCFIDISKYRQFIDHYGNPNVNLYAVTHSGDSSSNWNDLNDVSILKAYGYNASQKENLSDELRHELLAEIADLNIRTVSQIIYMLNQNITNHPGLKNYEARQKWKMDIAFIEQYRVNTDRFLVGKRVKK